MENRLYIIPTPIGNLKDITLRALEILEKVDIIYCEDTRKTIKLLNHYNIKNKLKSYHEHNENFRKEEILNELENGLNIAIVSDAGMPGISDPGHIIIKYLLENNKEVEVLPGATASITALVVSGMDSTRFTFLGFFPREKKEMINFIDILRKIDNTSIIYESVHRIKNTLKILGIEFPERYIVVCRELTKLHEEKIRGKCKDVYDIFKDKENIKGEFVLILDKAEIEIVNYNIEELIEIELKNGFTKKQAVKNIVDKYGLNKNEVYKASIDIR